MNDELRKSVGSNAMSIVVDLAVVRAERSKDLKLPRRIFDSIAALPRMRRATILWMLGKATPQERCAIYVYVATRIPEDRLIVYFELQLAIRDCQAKQIGHRFEAL